MLAAIRRSHHRVPPRVQAHARISRDPRIRWAQPLTSDALPYRKFFFELRLSIDKHPAHGTRAARRGVSAHR
eukprot:5081205-Prymnesium_polylepis.1